MNRSAMVRALRQFTSSLTTDLMLWVGLCLVLALQYAKLLGSPAGRWIVIGFAVAATVPVAISAVRALLSRAITVDLLAGVALIAAILNKEWASVLFINLMIASARIFAAYVARRSEREIEALLKLRPDRATVERDGALVEVAVADIVSGDRVVVKLGERVPIDGSVIHGEASVDQASLTGESVPVAKRPGDRVLSASVVVVGTLVIKAEQVGADTTLEKIIALVESSQQNKAKIDAISNRFASYYIIAMFAVAIGTYLFSHSLSLVLAVLLVSCADDLAVAVPMAFSVSIARGARRGIIIKGGDFIERIADLKTVVMDKTGTLTRGVPRVERVFAFDDRSETEVLSVAASASVLSRHPAALAVMRCAAERSVSYIQPDQFFEQSGHGVRASLGDTPIFAGKSAFLAESGIAVSAHALADVEREKEKGMSIMIVGKGAELLGFIAMADEVRPEASAAIAALRRQGVDRIVMLTGDNERIAHRVGTTLGVDEYHADLMPEDKLAFLREAIDPARATAMVGDGVNDAAALALADIGIAMGSIGSDVAIESADVALMKDDLSKVPELMAMGKRTMRIVRQDIWIWGIVNAIGLVLVFGGFIDPAGAAAYNFATDFFPILNSFRLFK